MDLMNTALRLMQRIKSGQIREMATDTEHEQDLLILIALVAGVGLGVGAAIVGFFFLQQQETPTTV